MSATQPRSRIEEENSNNAKYSHANMIPYLHSCINYNSSTTRQTAKEGDKSRRCILARKV